MTNRTTKLKSFRQNHHEEGYSLIELMVAVTITMILAAVVLPSILTGQLSDIRRPVENDVRSAADAVATYFNRYPNSGDIVIATPACEGGQKTVKGINTIVSSNNTCISAWGNPEDGFYVRGTNKALKGEYKYSSIEQKYTRTGAYQTKKTTQGG